MKTMLFCTSRCQPCKMMKPIIADRAEHYSIPLEVYDCDADMETAQKYSIRRVPTLIVEEHWEHTVLLTWMSKPEEIDALYSQLAWK